MLVGSVGGFSSTYQTTNIISKCFHAFFLLPTTHTSRDQRKKCITYFSKGAVLHNLTCAGCVVLTYAFKKNERKGRVNRNFCSFDEPVAPEGGALGGGTFADVALGSENRYDWRLSFSTKHYSIFSIFHHVILVTIAHITLFIYYHENMDEFRV